MSYRGLPGSCHDTDLPRKNLKNRFGCFYQSVFSAGVLTKRAPYKKSLTIWSVMGSLIFGNSHLRPMEKCTPWRLFLAPKLRAEGSSAGCAARSLCPGSFIVSGTVRSIFLGGPEDLHPRYYIRTLMGAVEVSAPVLNPMSIIDMPCYSSF